MRRILNYGLSAAATLEVGCCATVICALLYQCRGVTVPWTPLGDVIITLARASADLAHRKGRRHRRPLKLDYAINPTWASDTGSTHCAAAMV